MLCGIYHLMTEIEKQLPQLMVWRPWYDIVKLIIFCIFKHFGSGFFTVDTIRSSALCVGVKTLFLSHTLYFDLIMPWVTSMSLISHGRFDVGHWGCNSWWSSRFFNPLDIFLSIGLKSSLARSCLRFDDTSQNSACQFRF